ncbi:hypothetical protein H0H92_007666 [Tricholoma furcatifolium]|nr:hypothetical protein H0H92_007666 [Tricholoma furcatifolium]
MPRPIHSVIHLDELVRRICDYLTELTNDDVEIPLQRDLAALARVSKAFRDVCLDFLWRSLPSPAPLVKLLPAIQVLDGELVICGAISDWSTFDTYAKRVRSITINPSLVVSKTFNELQHNRSTPLLPSLKHIIILKTANSWLGGPVLPLVQPTLESLQIDDVYKDNILIPFLWSLHQKAPSIKQLSLPSIAKFPVALQFQQLQSLCITQPATLLHIWTLSGLKIESLSATLQGARLPKNNSRGFKELTALTLTGSHYLIIDFLDHIQCLTSIKTLRIFDSKVPQSGHQQQEWEKIFYRLFKQTKSTFTLSSNLKISSLTLDSKQEWASWPEDITSLKLTYLSARGWYNIPERSMVGLATLYLQVLYLSTTLSLPCLRHLATHCPNLKRLEAGDLSDSEYSAGTGFFAIGFSKQDPEIVLSHGLQRLTVSPENLKAKRVENCLKFNLVEALDRLFPQVVLVSADPVWKEAGILLTFFQKARGAERIRVRRDRVEMKRQLIYTDEIDEWPI